jgi:3-oxoadipate CoA-transferase, beta subunit
MTFSKIEMARVVAREVPDGALVNLGIGLPILVAGQFEDREVIVHSENGIVGMGGPAAPGDEDPDLVDAGKAMASLRVGGSFVSHADSFAIIRGGHIDVSVMGAFQVSGTGDLANWWNGAGIPGVGGAMDLAVGARRVLVMMRHVDADGHPKLVAECGYPLTAAGCVDLVVTEYGVFEPTDSGRMIVRDIAPGHGIDEVRSLTGVPLERA